MDPQTSTLPAPSPGERTVVARVAYVGISGVLHPSKSLYKLLFSRLPVDDGHHDYEGVPVLERALAPWPDARIVLTSTVPWKFGLPWTLEQLGPALAERVIGFTYDDLTTKLRRGTRHLPLSDADYWRCNKSDVVRTHFEWLRPDAWVAIDDESIFWTRDERRDHLVLVDGCRGLLDPAAQDRLLTVLRGNFGAETVDVGP